jgi:hypothetical protein
MQELYPTVPAGLETSGEPAKEQDPILVYSVFAEGCSRAALDKPTAWQRVCGKHDHETLLSWSSVMTAAAKAVLPKFSTMNGYKAKVLVTQVTLDTQSGLATIAQIAFEVMN